MKPALFLRDVWAQLTTRRAGDDGSLPVHTVDDAQVPSEIKPPGGL